MSYIKLTKYQVFIAKITQNEQYKNIFDVITILNCGFESPQDFCNLTNLIKP